MGRRQAPGGIRFVRKNFVDVGMLLALAACAWGLPERFWAAFCRRFAAIASGVQRTPTRKSIEHIRRACGFHPVRTRPEGIHSEAVAAHYLERVHILACYRPWTWTSQIELHGYQHLTDALSRGGAILWVGNFYYSSLITKMAFQRHGVDVTQLSRPMHGFLRTEFGSVGSTAFARKSRIVICANTS
jgi:hypothetical protein